MIQGIFRTVLEKKNGCTGLLFVIEVYVLQLMNMLNSIFGAYQDTSKKGGKTKEDKKEDQAAGVYINCLFKIL